jgi:phage host-nuclease inhibitor protein Gam
LSKRSKEQVKGLATPVPQSREEAAALVAEIGELQRAHSVIEAAMNEELAHWRQFYEGKAAPLAENIRLRYAAVRAWSEANRDAITEGGKRKTVQLTSGEIRWRVTPPKVVLSGVKALLKLLRDKGLERFIRTKEEPDKEAMLADRTALEKLKGIKFEQREEFVIVPFETKLEAVG